MTTPNSAQARDDARLALAAADDGESRLLAAITYGRASPYLMLWGLAWMAGFVGTFLAPERTGTIWLAVTALGWATTLLLALVQRRTGRERRVGLGARYSVSAMLMSAYAALWAFVLLSGHANAVGIYAGTVTGFAYLVAGLWRGPLLAVLGGALTALFLAGFAMPPTGFLLYAGLLGGGGLVAAGLLLARRDPT
ncbi:hypothetical protein FF100_02075 [Methylobacterium terricola]|uniref:Uncharacterized protein n=1 Tax=Methylobacterium terricola TaxID=2583531 RepID=A0A5C4LQN1_9HYPH|nr:hypothetical protein [Methylobacterium terricola]TNC16075.1 hypothetical protein FF100_02075 [Methylobacterium terricola]